MDMLPEYGVNPAQEWDEDFVTLVLQPAHLVGSEQVGVNLFIYPGLH